MSTARKEGAIGSPLRGAGPVLLVLVAVGVITFGVGLSMGMPWSLATWQAFHINFLYWMGLAFAGTVISAIFELTASRWGKNVRRLAENSIALIPIALLAYGGVVIGHHTVAHHLHDHHHMEHLNHAKQVWLQPWFMHARDFGALLLLSAVTIAFVYYSLRPALGKGLADRGKGAATPLATWITKGFRGYERESARSTRVKAFLAPTLVITYAVVLTLIAFDQIMALDSSWISTLFGAYFFITNLYLGWAVLTFTSVMARRRKQKDLFAEAGKRIRMDDLHDLGKLTFAFCMLSADFFWSQFVVIWYGNIPEETPFIIRRVFMDPWQDVSWAVAFLCFAIPFVLLLPRRVKRNEVLVSGITLTVLIMVWIERFLLVAPSIWLAETLGEEYEFSLAPQLLLGLGVTLGFLGLAGLAYRWLLDTFLLAAPEGPGDEDEGHHGHETEETPEADEEMKVEDNGSDEEEAEEEADEEDEEDEEQPSKKTVEDAVEEGEGDE